MENRMLYVIGDVHGRADLLARLIGYAEADARSRRADPAFYFLGDIVDRGPDSLASLNLVAAKLAQWEGSALHLGNHDQWFVDAVRTRGRNVDFRSWLGCGGVATLRSFRRDISSERDVAAALDQVADEHGHLIDMLEAARLLTSHGRIAFCHAGVDRSLPLRAQDKDTLIWIREPFLSMAGREHPVIVHGHTIFEGGPIVADNRISLDAGAFASGRLVALRIAPERRETAFMEAAGYGKGIETREIEPRLLVRGQGTALDRMAEVFDDWTSATVVEDRPSEALRDPVD